MEDLPSIDEWCGRHFRYRDLTEVGSTWKQNPVPNRPQHLATYEAMRTLCAKILDPVHDRFGRLELTYGFVSPALDKLVRQKSNPNTTRNRDQHAGCELNARGAPYCPRLGLAVDFRCPESGSALVARWVAEHTEFDSLYFYSDGRPFHVSVGPENRRHTILMQPAPPGLLMPRRVSEAVFVQRMSALSRV